VQLRRIDLDAEHCIGLEADTAVAARTHIAGEGVGHIAVVVNNLLDLEVGRRLGKPGRRTGERRWAADG
jgi:hypothetical protein